MEAAQAAKEAAQKKLATPEPEKPVAPMSVAQQRIAAMEAAHGRNTASSLATTEEAAAPQEETKKKGLSFKLKK